MDIRDVPVLVTGGGRRIGAASVLALADAGAAVIIHYGSSADAADELCRQIKSRGGRAASVAADLARPQEVVTLGKKAGEFFGPVRILINNAAISRRLRRYQTRRVARTSGDQSHRALYTDAGVFSATACRCCGQGGQHSRSADSQSQARTRRLYCRQERVVGIDQDGGPGYGPTGSGQRHWSRSDSAGPGSGYGRFQPGGRRYAVVASRQSRRYSPGALFSDRT